MFYVISAARRKIKTKGRTKKKNGRATGKWSKIEFLLLLLEAT